ncbi:MerR family transcriptional regulator [Sphaerochaeta sp.]|uniref:helix-turn-helix domain-containing protein n=1 Tax=Sphaerochaeta sp. TaxID=1972642 RepID=UPI003D0FCADC
MARKCNVTARTIRYYESLGLLKTNSRSEGGQRYYTDADVVYLNRIAELKELDFSLNEIRSIILMGSDDATGEKRRNELLKQYRSKLSEALERQAALEKRISDLTWHVQQLETNDDFQQCPGLMCKNCTFRERCRFKELS